jgi:hypothetical protein
MSDSCYGITLFQRPKYQNDRLRVGLIRSRHGARAVRIYAGGAHLKRQGIVSASLGRMATAGGSRAGTGGDQQGEQGASEQLRGAL